VENGRASDATGQSPGGLVASGGGIRDQGGAGLMLDNMVYSNNSATGAGGGLWSDGLSTTITQSTFQNNSAGGKGGGIFVGGGTFLLQNSTVTGNTTAAGTDSAPDVFGQVSDLATSTGNTIGVTDAGNTNLSNGLRAANLQFNTPLGTAGVFVDQAGSVFELASALGGSVNLTQLLNLGPSLYASAAFTSTGQVLVLTQQDGTVLQLTLFNGQGSLTDLTPTLGGTSRAVSVALINGVEFLVATDTAGNVSLVVPGFTSSPVNLTSLFNLSPAQTATLNFNSLTNQLALVVTDVNGGVTELSLAGAVDLTPFLGATGGKTASLAFPDVPNASTTAVLDVNEAGDVLVTFLVNGAATGPVNLGPAPFPTGTTAGTGQVTLTPAVTQGPYFQDFSDTALNRSNVTEGQQGVSLTLTFHVYQVSGTTVTPLSGARVDIWSANAFGVYSDETVQGTAGQTFLRGYQFTDATGTVTFQTIIPGWYPGRTPHIHFMVRTASSSGTLTNRVTSQLFFDQSFINSLFTTTAPYSTRGLPDTTNASDMVYNTTTSTGAAAGPFLTLGLTQTASGYAATYNVYVGG
jgi:protocatechuate 3,4-dioxygenase beta subunit